MFFFFRKFNKTFYKVFLTLFLIFESLKNSQLKTSPEGKKKSRNDKWKGACVCVYGGTSGNGGVYMEPKVKHVLTMGNMFLFIVYQILLNF